MTTYSRSVSFVCVLGAIACGAAIAALQDGRPEVDHGEFGVSGLRATIGNNAPVGEHRRGYNGIFVLDDPSSTRAGSAFVPQFAGFNLEHYFDASRRPDDPRVFFEPRHAPMAFRRLSATMAELHQPPTPHYGVESWTRFELKEPYYVDVAFRCIPRKPGVFKGGFMGVFWASYINAPLNKSMYFIGGGASLQQPVWTQFSTATHGAQSTVRAATESVGSITFDDPADLLYANVSPLQYAVPFFYGHVRDHVVIVVFKPGAIVRFAHSPSGGGPTAAGDDTNPAWDFQLIVPNVEVGESYGLEARLVYKPWVDRADVLREVHAFLESADSRP